MVKAIEAIRLTKYYGKIQALKDVNLNIKEGECYVLLGPNGAGKTTTLKILTGVLFPTEGKAFIYGHDVIKEKRKIKNLIGVMEQFPMLDPFLSVYENLKFFCMLHKLHDYKSKIYEIMEKLNLIRIKDKKAWFLSGGEIRRLQLARALILNPKIMFLDEPTLGIDIMGKQIIWDIIKEKNQKGTTVFINTNDLVEAENLAHTIGFLEGGVLLKEGNLFDLRKEMSGMVIELKVKEIKRELIEKINKYNNIKKINERKDIVEIYIEKENLKEIISLINFIFDKNNIEGINTRELNLSEIFAKIASKNESNTLARS